MAQAMTKNCPICRRPVTLQHQPFCSTRCANVDLGRWLGESYRVPGDEEPEEIIRVQLPSGQHEELD